MADKLEVFEEWFLNGGGHFGKHVKLQYDAQRNMHLRVAEGHRIDAGSCIVSCPHTLALSDLNAREGNNSFHDSIKIFACRAAAPISNLNLFRFFLVEQLRLGVQSIWWPYIDTLPDPNGESPFNTPLYYSDDDLRWIRGTSLEHSKRKIEELWRAENAQCLQAAGQDTKDRYSWKLYKWAATVIASRSFPRSALEAGRRLVNDSNRDMSSVLLPGLDLLNHNPTAKVTWQWGEETCSIRTDVALTSGTEIFNNYAPKSNEELIMGYGFSLFRNLSDHCNLALGAIAVAHVQGILNSQGVNPAVEDPVQNLDSSASESTKRTGSKSSISGLGWVRLTQCFHDEKHINPTQPAYKFSPRFLGQASLAFANTREQLNATITDSTDFTTIPMSRNKSHTMCTITMMLQKHLVNILTRNAELPTWPMNERQFYAARYRRGQILILRTVIQSMLADIRRHVGLDQSWPRDKRIMRIDHILKAGPKQLLQDFRAALHVGLGTRDPEKIKRQNSVETAFTLWLCALWLWTSSTSSSQAKGPAKSDLPARTANWMDFVRKTYGEDSSIRKKWAGVTASEEGNSTTETCYYILKAAVAKNPGSLYNCPEANVHRLLWCLRVVREESFMCPNLEGDFEDENDELMLFLENDAEDS